MSDVIRLDGVRVHNLRGIDVEIPRGRLTVICGVSGSGKTSLAFDTLFAEGQRRYIETFSPGARQFLDRIERPAADRIDGIPPAIAVRQQARVHGPRSTVGSRTALLDFLRLLYLRAGQLSCPDCRRPVRDWTPQSAATQLTATQSGQRIMVAFPLPPADDAADSHAADAAYDPESLLRAGYSRAVTGDRTVRLSECEATLPANETLIVLDRLRLDADPSARLQESVESAWAAGQGRCTVLVEFPDSGDPSAATRQIDGRLWQSLVFARHAECEECGRTVRRPELADLSFHSPRGACPRCEGAGSIAILDLARLVDDASLSLQDGAITVWQQAAYRRFQETLLQIAGPPRLRPDVPFAELTPEEREIVQQGLPDEGFPGVRGFHNWLSEQPNRRGAARLLRGLRTWQECPDCAGSRLNAEASCLTLAGVTLSELCRREISETATWLLQVEDQAADRDAAGMRLLLAQIRARLDLLVECGLSYVALERSTATLSGGEAQRVMLASVLGTGLIHTLYVLDEPTSGLHSAETQRMIGIVHRLRDAGNTVVVVEHDRQFIRAADHVIEIGPGAGAEGGRVVFEGTPEDLSRDQASPTGSRLRLRHDGNGETDEETTGRLRDSADVECASPETQRLPRAPSGWLTLRDVRCHNLRGLDVRLPLGVLCAVTGVSGSGKSSLIIDSLYPAWLRRQGCMPAAESSGFVGTLEGHEVLDGIRLLDQTPLLRSGRSVPATWIGAFDDIRRLLADTHEAKKRNFRPGMFSFNSAAGGRCPVCRGLGVVTIEMQFLADVQAICDECRGRRFRSDILEVRYRDRSVSDILEMTGDEAFGFFNGQRRIQRRLNALRQVGLGYLRLGQPLSTVSGGESQRLRIAALLAGIPGDDALSPTQTGTGARQPSTATLFLLDEPSTGLHVRDIDRLIECLDQLVRSGHSVIVIEHDEYLIRQCDYQLTMGPGPGRLGGQVIASGPLGDPSAETGTRSGE